MRGPFALRSLLIICLALPMSGCRSCKDKDSDSGGASSPPPPPPTGIVDIDADTNRNGTVEDAADDAAEDQWTKTGGAVFYYNIDDDDNNNSEDYKDTAVTPASDANDLARVWLRQHTPEPAGGSVTVFVNPAAAQGAVRIFRNNAGTWTQVYSAGASFALPTADLAAGEIELGLEAIARISAAWDGIVDLMLEVKDSAGASLGTDTIRMRCAPYIMATNLWPAEQLHVVNVTSGSGNATFRSQVQSVATAAGATYIEIPGGSYNNDRWIQDSSEPGIEYLPTSSAARRRVDNVLQLARWRPVDQWCRNALWASDFDFFERFSSNSSSLNYGGNVECVPPHTNGSGTAYDWGRVIIGGGSSPPIGGGATVTRYQAIEYRQFWDALKLQGPYLQISTEWLAVGHVDEICVFLPAPATARKWVVGLASPAVAKSILQTVQSGGGGSKLVFAGRTGWQTTVDAILADSALMTYNDEVQVRIDQTRLYLKNNIGLADSEIIDLPTLFEPVTNGAAAYNPGMANIMPLPKAGGAVYLIIPDPEGPDHPATDAWQADVTAKLQPLGTGSQPIVINYVDVFFSYHTLLGEAHCGLNTVRTPPAMDWWDK